MSVRPVVLRGTWAWSAWGQEVALELLTHGLPPAVAGLRFTPPARDWRFDLAWPRVRVAVEFDGATYGTALCDEMTGEAIRHSAGKLVRQPGSAIFEGIGAALPS